MRISDWSSDVCSSDLQSVGRLAARRPEPEAALMRPLLEVENLRVEIPGRRGTLVAVDGISFEIGEGEVLGVVGESGAGKSLTGAAVIGLLDPPCRIAGGEVAFTGRCINRPPFDQLPPLQCRHLSPPGRVS